MIGICTRWRKTDATHAALSVARRLHELACPFIINCYDWRSGDVAADYDKHVHHIQFQKWLSTVKHIIWTAPVDSYFITQARKKHIRSSLYTSWDQLEPYDEKVLAEYTHILVPSVVQAMQLRDKFKLRNVAMLPYDPGVPSTLRGEHTNCVPGRTKLFLSLYGAQLRRVDLSAILVLATLMQDLPQVDVTIACSKGLAMYTQKELKQLAKKFPGRWRNLFNCKWTDQVIEMSKHDLTVWPAKWDGFGIVGTTSLAMGTPVIAWDMPPVNEHLASGRNSILVQSSIEYNWIGMPSVKPNYQEFDRVLRWLITDKTALAELRKHTAERFDERRDEFRKGWAAVLPHMY